MLVEYLISGFSQFYILVALFVLTAIGSIWFDNHQPRWLFYILKPLTIVLIILFPLLAGSDWFTYKTIIIAGLFFSLTGDVVLMLPKDRILVGLIAFLGAHMCYIGAFSLRINEMNWLPLLPLLGIGVLSAYSFSPNLGRLRIPVYLYIGIILVMFWLAWMQFIQETNLEGMLIFLGAGLFVISDLIWGISRFKGELKFERILILGSYYSAQWLIACSAA